MNDTQNVVVEDHIQIQDKNTKKIIVKKRGKNSGEINDRQK